MTRDIIVNSNLTISSQYLQLSYSRSSGPGGQNVNKLNTRVGVCLNIPSCGGLTEQQKKTLLCLLRNRIDNEGNLRIFCQDHRSQAANRNTAIERLGEMIRIALKPRRRRIKTKTPRSVIEKRLSEKKKKSELKKLRSGRPHGD